MSSSITLPRHRSSPRVCVWQVYVFHPPAEARLVARLKTVCTREGLPVAAPSLSALCAAAGMDIRAGTPPPATTADC